MSLTSFVAFARNWTPTVLVSSSPSLLGSWFDPRALRPDGFDVDEVDDVDASHGNGAGVALTGWSAFADVDGVLSEADGEVG